MAKYLVTGFTPESSGEVTANGIFIDGDVSSVLSVWNIRFDSKLITPVRQQIESVMLHAVNEQIANYSNASVVLTQADIEYLI